MRDKKSKSSSLERKRFIFLEIGAIIALAAVLVAFNYRSYNSGTYLDFDRKIDNTPEEWAIITVQRSEPPLVAPPVPAPSFNIINDGEDVDTDFKIDVEVDQYTEIADYVPFIPDEIPDPEPEPIIFVEQLPAFPGGENARISFLHDNLEYPTSAKEIGISGTVYLQFVVETDGRITDVKAIRGPGGELNEEAVRVTCLMPNWEPGLQQGKAVRVLFTMPIKFRLQ